MHYHHYASPESDHVGGGGQRSVPLPGLGTDRKHRLLSPSSYADAGTFEWYCGGATFDMTFFQVIEHEYIKRGVALAPPHLVSTLYRFCQYIA